jgi:maltooligosyltrehalose trehalohydrolase
MLTEIRDDGVQVRVWAPRRKRVAVVIDGGGEVALAREDGGYWSALVAELRAGSRYRFRLDDDETLYPDPASRFQPEGPHGSSEVIDPSAYEWSDAEWRGIESRDQVLYEMHCGTFTREGTWRAAMQHLGRLRDTGITIVELMPVNEFAGRFGWGYDGVDLYAPSHLYGRPDDFRAFVDAAHAHGLGVILDVVYNHLGPDGNYLKAFSADYFTDKYENEWGDPINFDGDDSEPVREFFVGNAAYWIEEFHLDGLRVDATQSMPDESPEHILSLITKKTRAAARKPVYIVAENEPQDVRLFRDHDFDATWNDDFHHTARVALTGRREAYYVDYGGTPQEFISAAKYGFLYQGQRYEWQKKRRGSVSIGFDARRFVCYLENHDQVANSATGARLHHAAAPAQYRVAAALLILGPWTPMLFQGQEFGSSAPFLYFADHKPEIAKLVANGRKEFLCQFPSIKEVELALPHDERTFTMCKLNDDERAADSPHARLYRDLLALRRERVIDAVDGAVLAPHAFLLRSGDWLFVFNFGADVKLHHAPEPLLAPPENKRWVLRWSSESPQYGGFGTPEIECEGAWSLAGQTAVVFHAASL